VAENLEELSRLAGEAVIQAARDAIARRGRFGLALAGGRTPRRLYEWLGAEAGANMPWHQVHLFWSDERCVPPHDPHSNYRMARRGLIDRVPIPARNVHRIRGEQEPVEEAAVEYERALRDFGPLDLVLLGLGADGHTASLFPGHPALEERERWVRAVPERLGQPPCPRVTLTLVALGEAHQAFFLAAGREKRGVVRAVVEGQPPAAPLPAARVRPQRPPVWFVDEAAWGECGG